MLAWTRYLSLVPCATYVTDVQINPVASKAFKKIMAGLEDARAHLNGDATKGTVIASAPRLTDIDVARLRRDMNMSQEEFAVSFGVSIGTLQGWEQGRRQPVGPARVLLNLIRKNPRAFDVLRADKGGKHGRGRTP
jgi:putative transcriptional regulator